MKNVFAQGVSSTELITKEKDYDGRNIVFEGEVIGDIMKRGDFFWVNVNDGNNAIGVWATKEAVSKIKYSGDFKHTGDKVQIKGVFNRNCPQHGGDLDIHAQEIDIISVGYENAHNIDLEKIKVVKSLTITLIIVVVIWIFKVLRKR